MEENNIEKNAVFWDDPPYSLVYIYQGFRETYYLNLQEERTSYS
jgi:hypothetical protein